MTAAACPTEHQEQVAVIQWARLMSGGHPELKLLLAIPNGGHRHKAVAGKLSAEGVRAGVPDLFLPVARGKYHGLWIEMKRRRGGKVTLEQRVWHMDLDEQGYAVYIALGADQAIQIITNYLGI